MKTEKVQAILAIVIVTIFMVVTGIIAIYSYANDLEGITDSEITLNHLKNYTAIFTGIVGTIIGYYFGKGKTAKEE